MSATSSDKKRWDDLHAAYAKAEDAESAYGLSFVSKYGSQYERSWLTRGQQKKLEDLRDRKDKIGDKIFELVERVSPRDWSHGVPAHWIRRDLTWEDAIRPKSEPLSVVPPLSYGSSTPMQEAPMKRTKISVRDLPQAEAAGEHYATDQLQSDYFMDWVRDQLLEASKMPADEVLPLETKDDALKIAKNMLQQLEWDTKRGLEKDEMDRLLGDAGVKGSPETATSFYEGFHHVLNNSRDWLADELLELESQIHPGIGGQQSLPGVNEARRAGRPLIDDKIYSVTWRGGRAGPMSDKDIVALVRDMRRDWREAGHQGTLEIQVWYRDGSLVPYADLERRVGGLSKQIEQDPEAWSYDDDSEESKRRRGVVRSSGLPNSISMYQPAQVFINGKYQVSGTMTPSHGPEAEVRTLLHITRTGDIIEVKQDENVWTFIRDEDSPQGFRNKDAPASVPRRRGRVRETTEKRTVEGYNLFRPGSQNPSNGYLVRVVSNGQTRFVKFGGSRDRAHAFARGEGSEPTRDEQKRLEMERPKHDGSPDPVLGRRSHPKARRSASHRR
jgi:hypothetical protein